MGLKWLSLLIFLPGCAASLLNPLPDDIPDGAEVIRCTQYEGIVSSYFNGSSVAFRGCQCVRMSKSSGDLLVDMSDCSAILESSSG